MKKLIYLLALGAALGCTNSQDEILDSALGCAAEIVTIDTVSSVPTGEDISAALDRAGFGGRAIIKESVIPVMGNMGARGQADTLLYIAPFSECEGYAIVAAKPIENTVLAVVDSGSWKPDENPGLQMYVELAKSYVESESQMGIVKAPARPEFEETVLVDEIIEPRVKVKWDQKGIYGSECPNGSVGCVSLSIGQALTYFKIPAELTLTYKNNRKLSLDWEKINGHINSPCSCEAEVHTSIAMMLREIGKLSSSDYIDTGDPTSNYTSSNYKHQREALKALGLSFSSVEKVTKGTGYGLYTALKRNNSILFVSGVNQDGVGHSWLVSGGKYRTVKHTFYMVYINTGERIVKDEVIKSTTHLYVNWGAVNGSGDGYYLEDVYKLGLDHYDTDLNFYSVYK